MIWLILTCAISYQGEKLEFSQFEKLMAAGLASIEDVEFICEGSVRFRDDADPDREEKRKRIDLDFQVDFAYRRPSAGYLRM